MTADQILGVLNDRRPSQTRRFMPWMTADHHRPDVLCLEWPQTKCYNP